MYHLILIDTELHLPFGCPFMLFGEILLEFFTYLLRFLSAWIVWCNHGKPDYLADYPELYPEHSFIPEIYILPFPCQSKCPRQLAKLHNKVQSIITGKKKKIKRSTKNINFRIKQWNIKQKTKRDLTHIIEPLGEQKRPGRQSSHSSISEAQSANIYLATKCQSKQVWFEPLPKSHEGESSSQFPRTGIP